jgi:hypothetical protein
LEGFGKVEDWLGFATPRGPGRKVGSVEEVADVVVKGDDISWRDIEVLSVDCEGVLIGLGNPTDGRVGTGGRASV